MKCPLCKCELEEHREITDHGGVVRGWRHLPTHGFVCKLSYVGSLSAFQWEAIREAMDEYAMRLAEEAKRRKK